jgi:transposase InsO family protein
MTGSKYALTIRDTYTTYSEVKILKTKAEAAKSLMQTVTRWETQVNKSVKIIRSDNGGEFESKALADWIAGKGIQAERLLPYHHFQNGAAERYNRTVADMGRTLLYDSSLGEQFWGYAFIWSAWTLNRLPNKNTQDLNPYKCFYGEKPQLDETRVFGSTAFVLVAPEKHKKLDDRAIEGKVVGHLEGSKGWTFWIPATKQLVSLAGTASQLPPM